MVSDKLEFKEVRPGIVSAAVLGRLFNITERRIHQLVKMSVIPKGDSRGEYLLTAAIRGYINFLQKDGLVDEELAVERLRQEIKVLKGKNRKQDRENDRNDNLLVDVEESSYQMGLIAKSGLRILETLADSLERDYKLDPEIIEGIEIKIDLYRNEWADYVGGNQ